jgi:hypothetical protein
VGGQRVPGNDPTLFELAEKQDRFEHEYSSQLVTRIGLFLVFAGFVSGVAVELLKLILAEAPAREHYQVAWLLVLSTVFLFLFAAMVILLRAALMPGYSVPGTVSNYRQHYRQLLEYHKGDAEKARSDLLESIIDATAEAVDQNSARNADKASAITWASRLLLASIVTLFLGLSAFVWLHFDRRGGQLGGSRVIGPESTLGITDAQNKERQQKVAQRQKEADTPCK